MAINKKLNNIIYIDAISLVPSNKSGIGYTLEQTLAQLTLLMRSNRKYSIKLVVPLGKAKYLAQYREDGVTIQTIYLPARILEVFMRLSIFPPMDWLLGNGIYVFPNYRNWPLWNSRSLTYVYDVAFKKFPEMVQPKNQKYLSRYMTRWLSRADKVITISQQVEEEIEMYLGIPYTKISRVYCGVDTSVFKKVSQKMINETKLKYGINFDNYFIFVGNIEPRKNLSALLEAYSTLPPEIRESYGLVMIGGDGWLNESYYQQVGEMQRSGESVLKVKKYVNTSDLPALYSGSIALVHPAVYEGFGITPLEAMACETPVVVSDIPAIREVVQTAGYYFNPAETLNLAQAMHKVISDPNRRSKVEQGLSRSLELSWENSAQALLAVVDEQFSQGIRQKPLLTRLKYLYSIGDRHIREALGERHLAPYIPATATNLSQLRKGILNDYLKEQPSRLSMFLLRIYLGVKHRTSIVVKRIYRSMRAQR